MLPSKDNAPNLDSERGFVLIFIIALGVMMAIFAYNSSRAMAKKFDKLTIDYSMVASKYTSYFLGGKIDCTKIPNTCLSGRNNNYIDVYSTALLGTDPPFINKNQTSFVGGVKVRASCHCPLCGPGQPPAEKIITVEGYLEGIGTNFWKVIYSTVCPPDE